MTEVHNNRYFEAWQKLINKQNEIALFVVSLDNSNHISLNTINDLPEEKIVFYLEELAAAIKHQQKGIILLPQNKSGLL